MLKLKRKRSKVTVAQKKTDEALLFMVKRIVLMAFFDFAREYHKLVGTALEMVIEESYTKETGFIEIRIKTPIEERVITGAYGHNNSIIDRLASWQYLASGFIKKGLEAIIEEGKLLKDQTSIHCHFKKSLGPVESLVIHKVESFANYLDLLALTLTDE